VADSAKLLGRVLQERGRLADAQRVLERAVAVQRERRAQLLRRRGEDDPDELRALSANLDGLGQVLLDRGDLITALEAAADVRAATGDEDGADAARAEAAAPQTAGGAAGSEEVAGGR
jgi:hypothetical protein